MSDDGEHSLPPLLLDQLAELARVPEASRQQFNELLASATEVAWTSDLIKGGKLPVVTAAKIVPFLRKVQKGLKSADTALARLQGDNVDQKNLGAAAWAGCLFENALRADAVVEDDSGSNFLPQVRAARKQLLVWREAATRAIEQIEKAIPAPGRGRPEGTGGNPAFDTFVRRMDEIAAATGGQWTHTRLTYSDECEWRGTLSPALEMLRPYLPPIWFFPDPGVNLGFAIERARKTPNLG
jgi:hypothetical protein